MSGPDEEFSCLRDESPVEKGDLFHFDFDPAFMFESRDELDPAGTEWRLICLTGSH